jgi:ABC-type transport system involved in multi-copper enzyme maturation permease subunit
MIKTIILKELRNNLLSFRFLITILLCVTLIPLGVYVSIQEYKNNVADYQQAQSLYQESIQGIKNALDVTAKGLRPPSPFSIFANGLDKYLPNEIVTSRLGGLTLGNNRSMDDPLSILFGKIDFLFSIVVVMSLLAILFTFDANTREKEEGTLRLTLSNAIPRHHILMGKYLGHFLTLLIPFAIALLISLLILSLSGIFPLFQAANLIRLLCIVGVALLFISIFFNLGLFISSITKRSLTSQIVLLFLWVLLIFAIPRASGMLARVIFPIETEQTTQLKKTLVRKNIEDEKANALKQAFLDSQREELDEGVQNYNDIREPIVHQLREKEKQQLGAIEEDHRIRQNTQLKLASTLSRLSPTASFAFLMTGFSNTGLQSMENLYRSAQQFHNDVSREIHSKGYKDDIPEMGMRMSMEWVSADDIPQFQTPHQPLDQVLQDGWVDILLLILFNVLFFTGAYVSFLRYDVR